jgi:hypothetical protein
MGTRSLVIEALAHDLAVLPTRLIVALPTPSRFAAFEKLFSSATAMKLASPS